MMGAGTLGVARRHWDITFADAAMGFDYPATAYLMMGLNGLSAILAALGGAMYVIITVASVFFGRKLAPDENYLPFPGAQGALAPTYGSSRHHAIPGTVVLVAIFFVAFVLYYFVNWKYLSEVWPLS
jgi:cytochrome c oxidase subunit 1